MLLAASPRDLAIENIYYGTAGKNIAEIGNIEDWISVRRRDYDHMIILDARPSAMTGDTHRRLRQRWKGYPEQSPQSRRFPIVVMRERGCARVQAVFTDVY